MIGVKRLRDDSQISPNFTESTACFDQRNAVSHLQKDTSNEFKIEVLNEEWNPEKTDASTDAENLKPTLPALFVEISQAISTINSYINNATTKILQETFCKVREIPDNLI